ncbi:ATP-binding protein [Kutzneria kofuensis]|uniref:Tetratricopeptide (TPR) repeat protein/transcriptional regulator with XRE-family HTH domain n=1 Tax=Kutzneria kofuensis TaxID=103725 RepID=A0A7W9KSI9_9PSEU|nr:helix-turn-helix domain-containing protein [Kutzneria kofuensis]MBB5897946.1 tetratricopeptide (TPR) repeat protein/transcriptional regulator with XRE-family HTH domain [Kutzneria kofuensis]
MAADQAALCALGAYLRRLRLRRGLSLRGMARRLGATGHSALVDFEHGRRLLPADLLALYRNAFPDDAAELSRLWDAVLSARAQVPPPVGTVAQLPADLVDFVDRDTELSRVLTWIRQATAVVTVSGEPGVGKSSFALHVAHRVRADYPDGQLYVALHGAGRQPLPPAQVLAKLLVPLGVPDNRLPADVDGRAALLRSVLASRRVLIVLDAAADETQVRPALPGHGESLVLITSRGPLAALDGARHVRLGVFAPDAALELFRRVAGADRVAAELHESRQIVAHCGHLPLATRLAAASIATWPRGQLRDWADELADRATRLDRLRVGDRAVNTVFELSYQAMSEPARTLFRRAPLLPGPDFGARTAATAFPDGGADTALAELTQRGMVQASDRARRYRMHDLLRLFAETRLDLEEAAADRESVERAVLGDLLGTAFDAGATLDPSGYAVPRPESRFADREAAVRWLDAEYRCVAAGMRRAGELGLTELVFPLLVALPWYWDLRCHWDEWRDVNTSALELAETVGDGLHQVIALNGLCIALRSVGDVTAAIEHGRAAVRLARRIERPDEEAGALDRLGCALGDVGQHETAASLFADAIRLNEQAGERWSLATTRRHLGEALRALGRLDQAAAAFEQAAREFAELDATRSQAMTYCGHAEVMLDRGALDEAAGLYRDAMESFRAHDDHWGVAYTRLGLGRVFAAAGRREDAARELTTAVDAFADLGDNSYQAAALRALAVLSDASA